MSNGFTTRPTSAAPAAWNSLLARRDLLRTSALGVGASLLPAGLRQSLAVEAKTREARSVILLWMAGGVTHIDSFDPKPDAPEEIRGTLGAISTSLPGVQFNEALPCLAQQAHRLAVVRSFSHDTNDHFLGQAWALSGRRATPAQITSEPNVGAIVSKLHGSRAGFPGYIAVPGTTRPGPPPKNLFTGGWLGMQYGPFSSGGTPRNEDFTAKVAEADETEFNQQSLRLQADVDAGRMTRRRSLLAQLEDRARAAEKQAELGAYDGQFDSAYHMLTAPVVRRAFDLSQESDATRERYGRTKIGQRCLLARRLVEADAPFVMVDYGYDPEFGNLWDNHCAPGQNQPHISQMSKLPYHLGGFDRGAAALVADLDERGLLDRTLVVFLTEFGRTPKINKLGGRDHWGMAGSIFFAGGGVRGGQVIGATDRQAGSPTTSPYGPWDVAATIYHALGIDPETILHDQQRRPMAVLPQGKTIPMFG
ncbi:MAG: DUF1501 domain-containing protein [Planctomycetes bacterium]|nr:DUF1501 domain-containing protein [Planctomycetota bacterium]